MAVKTDVASETGELGAQNLGKTEKRGVPRLEQLAVAKTIASQGRLRAIKPSKKGSRRIGESQKNGSRDKGRT